MEEGWERAPRIDLTLSELSRLTARAFPGRTISRFEVLTTGLANTNIRFWLQGQASSSYVLRAYTRDPQAAERERDLMQLLTQGGEPSLPVPPLIYSELAVAAGSPPYSIWGFVDGGLLQDLFKTLPPRELVSIAAACGEVLANLINYRFAACGAFGPGLAIAFEYGSPSRYVPEMIHAALFQGRAGARLGQALRARCGEWSSAPARCWSSSTAATPSCTATTSVRISWYGQRLRGRQRGGSRPCSIGSSRSPALR